MLFSRFNISGSQAQMKDAIRMWRDTRMVVLAALTAATYAAVLIPFKVVLPFIPGFTEFRPASVIPIVFSLLFGPPAAWGSAIGNLIGDVYGGTLTPASSFGFVGNFLYGYIPYKVWGRMGFLSCGSEPDIHNGRQILEYIVTAALAAGACATIIAYGVDIMGFVPFSVLSNFILITNLLVSAVLGPPLLAALYPRAKKWRLLYPATMSRFEGRGRRRRVLVLLLFIGIASGYLIGNALYFGAGKVAPGGMGLAAGVGPSIFLILISAALL